MSAPRVPSTATSAYVHFPWCERRCPYCDFSTRAVRRERIPHRAYADGVVSELTHRERWLRGRRLVSIFFGGGTPSLWEPRELGRTVRAIRGAFDEHASNLEVTVECNPASLSLRRLVELREAGVNRLSIGVQSLRDEHLHYLGRLHNARDAYTAVANAVAVIPRTSVDMMFGLPGQTWAQYREDLQRILDLDIQHISAYALTIEPQTRFGALARAGRLPIAREETFAEIFLAASEFLGSRGRPHYEVSNFAAPGQESLHNQRYWQGGPYLGLGAAAVGCLDLGDGAARRWTNQPDPERYLQSVARSEPSIEQEELDSQTIVREGLMLGLRTSSGVDLVELRARAGVDPYVGRETAIQRAIETGDLRLRGERWLTVPRERWLFLDGIVAKLF